MLDIAKLRVELEKNRRDPSLIAFMVRSDPEIVAAGLDDIAWSLSREGFGCPYNDVRGILDDLEEWRKKQAKGE